MAGINDLLQLLGIGGNVLPAPENAIGAGTRNVAAGPENVRSYSTEQPSPESQSGGGGGSGSSFAGILEGILSGMRGDPYGPANQRRDQIKMGIALATAKREAEEAKLRLRMLQLTTEREEQEAKLKQEYSGKLLAPETENVPLPEYNPEATEGNMAPFRPGAKEERPTGGMKLNITPGASPEVIKLFKGLFGEEAVNRQLGMGKPERVTTKEGETVHEKLPGRDWKEIFSGGPKANQLFKTSQEADEFIKTNPPQEGKTWGKTQQTGGWSVREMAVPAEKESDRIADITEQVSSAMAKQNITFPMKIGAAKKILGNKNYELARAHGVLSEQLENKGMVDWGKQRQVYPEVKIFTGVNPEGKPIIQGSRTGTFQEGEWPGEMQGGLGPKIEPTMTYEATKEMGDWRDLYDQSKEIKSIIEKSKKLAGPLTGRVRGQASKLISDPEFTKIMTKVGKLRPVIYALSGKQINPAEQEWLTNEILPNLKKPTENFIVLLDDFTEWVMKKYNSRLSSYTAAGYRTGKFEPISGKKIKEIDLPSGGIVVDPSKMKSGW